MSNKQLSSSMLRPCQNRKGQLVQVNRKGRMRGMVRWVGARPDAPSLTLDILP